MYKYGDLLKAKENGMMATIAYGSQHSSVFCIEFQDGKRYQIRESDLSKRFDKVHAICPKCGRKMVKSPLEDYKFFCEACYEDFYSIEVREYV